MNPTRLDLFPTFLHSGWQQLRKSPLTAGLAVASLALGIGVSTAAFSFLNNVFLAPPPQVEEADRLVTVYSSIADGPRYLPVSYTTYQTLDAGARSFSRVAAAQFVFAGVGAGARPEQLLGEMVSEGYFETLGVSMARGRTFTGKETEPSSHARVVILGHRLWQQRLGGDPDVVGQDLTLNGRPYTIVGVAAPGFKGLTSLNAPQFWVPFSVYEEVFVNPAAFDQVNGQVLGVVARLAPDHGLEQARQEADGLAARLREQYPAAYRDQSLLLLPTTEAQVYPGSRDRMWRSSLFLVVIGGILLASACVNVANILLIQSVRRARELALRLSLGAGRRTLVAQLLVENLILAGLGGGAGLLVAAWIWQALWHIRPPYFDQHALAFAFDAPTVLFAFAAAALTCFLFGLAPALRALRSTPAEVLKDSPEPVARHGLPLPGGALLVILQVGLSTMMLVAAGVFLTSLLENQRIDLGFAGDNLLSVSWDVRSQGYDEVRGRAFAQQAVERIRALPGVEAVSRGENRPLGGFQMLQQVAPWGDAAAESGPLVGASIVDPAYFSTLSIPLLRGRAFAESDASGGRPVAIVNHELARLLAPEDPLSVVGQAFRLDDQPEPVEVVGIARTVKVVSPDESPRPVLYLPSGQHYSSRTALHVRTAGPPEALLETVRREVQALEPLLPLVEVGTFEQHLDEALWAERMNVGLLGALSLVALLLAAAGVYGVTSLAVAQRVREIGIRMALGARPERVVLRLVRQGTTWVLLGVGLGLAASQLLAQIFGSLFYRLELIDHGILSLTLLILLSIGFFANLAPALRAARIDPLEALRM